MNTKYNLSIFVVLLTVLTNVHLCDSNRKGIYNQIDIIPEIESFNQVSNINETIEKMIWQKIGDEYGIDSDLLYSIAIVESKVGKKNIRPCPYAIRVNDKTSQIFFPETKQKAKKTLSRILKDTDNVDIGMMQINYHWHKDKISSPFDLLDPEINLRVAVQILSNTINSTDDIILGIGRYHSWDPEKAYRYGNKVCSIYFNLKKYKRSLMLQVDQAESSYRKLTPYPPGSAGVVHKHIGRI